MSDGHTQRLETALAARYKIERKLGEGGMATVYLAEDIKHERKVAVKLLRPELAAVIGAERFLSEIKTTANLQHPHILPLFDSGEADGFLYYVMPYIEGETLRELIQREQQLGVDEAVRISRDVADALDYAHRKDIIHRDIKPANILLHDGRPMVADFGIALAISAAGGGRMTETGLSLGTPHYMSPEQASADRDLSARSDVYSLGCVLYEMLAGQPPHTGPSAQNILVRILTESPRSVTEFRHTVPPHVASVVMKSIEKLPADRFASAREFLDALGDDSFTYSMRPVTRATTATPGDSTAAPGQSTRPNRGLAAAVAILAATTITFGYMALGSRGATAPAGAVTAFVMTDEVAATRPPVVSPDGSVVFPRDGMLYLRAPGALEAVPLEGTEGALFAAFSPGGEWLAFGQNEGGRLPLKRMPAHGGPITTLWTSLEPDGGALWAPAWGDDGWIYFDANLALVRIPEEGGPADTLLHSPTFRTTHITVLPDGTGLVATVAQGPVAAFNHVILMDLATRDTTTLIEDGFDARYVDTGHLIYAHSGGALYAMPFDAKRMEVLGPPVPVVDDAATNSNIWGRFDVSRGGTLVYTQGEPTGGASGGGSSFSLVDPTGTRTQRLPLEPTDHIDSHLSPDGRMLTYIRADQVWVYDTELGTNKPLTTEGSEHHNPIWSPDGSEIVFRAFLEGDQNGALYIMAADGSGAPRRIGDTPGGDGPAQWLDDGTILFDTELAGRDIFRIDASGDSAPVPLLQADWDEINPQVSPDGRWLAFMATESGSREVYLRRWPELGGKIQVTSDERGRIANSGIYWADDSRRFYYQTSGTLWEATLSGTDAVTVSVRDTEQRSGAVWGRHPDGRILTTMAAVAASSEPSEPAVAPRMVVVSNWLTALRARLGGGN